MLDALSRKCYKDKPKSKVLLGGVIVGIFLFYFIGQKALEPFAQ